MKILYIVALLSFAALAWAALAVTRHVRRSRELAAPNPTRDREVSEAIDLRLTDLSRPIPSSGPAPAANQQPTNGRKAKPPVPATAAAPAVAPENVVEAALTPSVFAVEPALETSAFPSRGPAPSAPRFNHQDLAWGEEAYAAPEALRPTDDDEYDDELTEEQLAQREALAARLLFERAPEEPTIHPSDRPYYSDPTEPPPTHTNDEDDLSPTLRH